MALLLSPLLHGTLKSVVTQHSYITHCYTAIFLQNLKILQKLNIILATFYRKAQYYFENYLQKPKYYFDNCLQKAQCRDKDSKSCNGLWASPETIDKFEERKMVVKGTSN